MRRSLATVAANRGNSADYAGAIRQGAATRQIGVLMMTKEPAKLALAEIRALLPHLHAAIIGGHELVAKAIATTIAANVEQIDNHLTTGDLIPRVGARANNAANHDIAELCTGEALFYLSDGGWTRLIVSLFGPNCEPYCEVVYNSPSVRERHGQRWVEIND